MSDDGVDLKRRKALVVLTSAAGGAATAGAVWPFVSSLQPSERAKALGAPTEVGVSAIPPGGLATVEWRGKPVWILRRTGEMIRELPEHRALLADPESRESVQPPYAENLHRSIKPEIFVAVGLCTHLGCIPTYSPDGNPAVNLSHAGFYCPCHGSRFDAAGRVHANVPAPVNLVIPPHTYLSSSRLLIGEDKAGA